MTNNYHSQYRGSVVDNAVATVIANRSKGSTNTPVYLDAGGTAIPITSYSGTADRANKDSEGNTITTTYATKSEVVSKQDRLVGGLNIKTINNSDIMGNGNLSTFPAQNGHAGQFLGTNGIDVNWTTVDMSSKQDVISDLATIRSQAADAANKNLNNLSATGEAHFDSKYAFKDLSNATALTKSTITAWIMPDWDNKVYRGTDYTLTEDCWVYLVTTVGWANTSSSSKAGDVCIGGGLGRSDSTMRVGGIWIGASGDHISGSFGIYTVPFVGRS